jgi:hypothetical protein
MRGYLHLAICKSSSGGRSSISVLAVLVVLALALALALLGSMVDSMAEMRGIG